MNSDMKKELTRDSLILNTEYAFSFGAYWMIYAVAGSFASVFMLAKGYTNTHIGITLAAASLIAVVLEPFVADRMDRSKGIQIIDSVNGSTADAGRILSLMAFMEIPTMLFFDKIKRLFKSRTMIKVAAFGFTAKIIVCGLARSASLAGGWIIDAAGVKTLLWVSALITGIGAVIVIMSVDRVGKRS